MAKTILGSIRVMAAPSSGGIMYALSGTTRAAKTALIERYGAANPGGYHIVTADEAFRLRDELRAA